MSEASENIKRTHVFLENARLPFDKRSFVPRLPIYRYCQSSITGPTKSLIKGRAQESALFCILKMANQQSSNKFGFALALHYLCSHYKKEHIS